MRAVLFIRYMCILSAIYKQLMIILGNKSIPDNSRKEIPTKKTSLKEDLELMLQWRR
jgi:hypothetical protein